jgi:drug/metabolite transporter (DMT)-like permease
VQTYVQAMVAAALYGTALVTTHFGLRYMNTLTGAKVSIPTAMVMFWILSPFMDSSGWEVQAVVVFALVGLFYPAAVTLLTYEANRRLGPTVTGTIGSTTPLFAVLGAAAFLSEALGIRELAATACVVLGTMALSKPPGETTTARPQAALWMPWSAALLRALAQVLAKGGLVLWPNPFVAALLGYSVSAVVVWTAGTLVPGGAAPAFNCRGAGWFAVTGLLNGAMLLSMYAALATGPVHVVAPIVATYPLFTLALSAVLLRQERLSRRLIGGVALTVAGVVILLAR